jgi:hypothetical protein
MELISKCFKQRPLKEIMNWGLGEQEPKERNSGLMQVLLIHLFITNILLTLKIAIC